MVHGVLVKREVTGTIEQLSITVSWQKRERDSFWQATGDRAVRCAPASALACALIDLR